MEIRELPAAEWHRLDGDPALQGQALPDPAFHHVVIAEEAGEIVAAWFMIQVIHLEPVWIKPTHRSTNLSVRMFRKLAEILDSCTIKKAFCFADRPEIAGYLQRLGMQKLPYETYLYEVAPCQHQ